VQAAFNAHHAAVGNIRSEINAAQQGAIRNIERLIQQDQARSARLGQEYIAFVVAGCMIHAGGINPFQDPESAAPPPPDDAQALALEQRQAVREREREAAAERTR
jgi:hypothetical protein